jgi:hypothetical protein
MILLARTTFLWPATHNHPPPPPNKRWVSNIMWFLF